MPEASQELRDMFFEYDKESNIVNDGILKCERIVRGGGGTIKNYMISFPVPIDMIPRDIFNAVAFLMHEWDYGFDYDGPKYTNNGE